MKLLKPFVLLSLFTSAVFSQVIIREKVEIKPKPSAVAVAGQLEVTLSLSGSLNPNRPASVRASNFGCGIDAFGGTSVSAPLQAGLYQIVGRFSTAGVVNYELRVKAGNDELLVEQGVAPANATIILLPQVGFSSGIKFSFGGPIVQGQTAGYGFIGFVSIPCSTPAVHPLLSTTLSITTGQGLGEFVDETGRLLGESVTRKLNELGGIGFIANGRSPVGSQEEVGIQATMGGGVAGTASLVVIKKQTDCSDAPPCDGPMTPPQITLRELKRNEVSPDPCLQPGKNGKFPAGAFRPLAIKENPVSPFDVQACFDRQAERWRFGIPGIEIKVFLDICENNLSQYRIVDDVSALSSNEACNALQDIIGHYDYPIQVTYGYVFRPILVEHEKRHKKDYEEAVKAVLTLLEKDIQKILIKCEEDDDLNDAVEKGRALITATINSFLTSAYDKYLKKTSVPNYEEKTQSSLFEQVKAIRDQLLAKCTAGGTL